MSLRVVLVVLVVAACSRKSDPAACAQRIARLEARFATHAVPGAVARVAAGYDVPRVPRDRAQPLGADGIVLVTGYDDRVMTVRGFGAHAGFSGERERGRPDVDAVAQLRRVDPAAASVPVYVIVPRREHQMIHLVDVLANIEPRFELRLVVGIEGSEADPAPPDARDKLRQMFRTLPPPNASERYSTLQTALDKAVGRCEGLGRAIIETADAAREPDLKPIVAMMRRCGCDTVDVPALEAFIAALTFNVGAPAPGWIPLDLGVTAGTVQELVANGGATMPAPEPGLGQPCRSPADCPPSASACVAFDRDGSWHPAGAPSCTRPCGAGCPKGFRCAREVAITGADQRGIRGDVTLWCGPVRAR